ncbi:DUF7033 domain-containing protein [Parapedobacter sp. 10938]|uniref:DUF7033 domain-containing protein n=1 Tax=Parapedobacter flavus TaxID=3110225 RepID=UPI002DBAAC62|nr:hypothetical protein [Parapedobacter sp. 10938]MEC3880161.1 hypothetical protein [Parapedobacter sp. 10938]
MGQSLGRVQVICPKNNESERSYIIQCLLGDFLDVKYELIFDDTAKNYTLVSGNGRIIFEDHFFRKFPSPLSYLSDKNLPQQLKWLENDLGVGLPIIFGNNSFSITADSVVCGLDVFASAFFFLSRWEEYVISDKAITGRCNEYALFVVKNNLFMRPIVNDYVEFLRRLLFHIGLDIPNSRKATEVLLTHDVDWCYLSSQRTLFRNLQKLAFKEGKLKKSLVVFIRYYYYYLRGVNPFDSFDDLIRVSKEHNLPVSFFFKACEANEAGFTYTLAHPLVKKMIQKVLNNGCNIGYHPSENTLGNPKQFHLELERLQNAVGENVVKGGRTHLLLYNKDTYDYWEKEALHFDSGMGFQYHNGFRSGVCYPYRIFDIYKRKVLNLVQTPFILMDTVFLRRGSTPHDIEKEAKLLIDTVIKYRGVVCMNWHSNLFNVIERRIYKKPYFNILEYLSKKIV